MNKLPEEIVSYISTYNGNQIYNKYSRKECRGLITKKRHEYAKNLEKSLFEFFLEDDSSSLESSVIAANVIESMQPERMIETLLLIPMILAYSSNWPEVMCDFWSYKADVISFGYYTVRPWIKSELWFRRLERKYNNNYYFMLYVLTHDADPSVTMWNYDRKFIYLNPYI